MSGYQPAGNARAKRTGGRSARVRGTVLAATVSLITEHGIGGLSISAVAAQAGVAETTVYRRWPTRTALIADALTVLAAEANPAPNTGTLWGDLHTVATQIAGLITSPGIARLLGTVAAMDASPEVAAARRAFWNRRFSHIATVVHAAIGRGELTADTDPACVIETLAAPLYFRLLITDEPLDTAFLTRCVDHTIILFRPVPDSAAES